MFYIRKRSIKFNNNVPYEAHLLLSGCDSHVGVIGNLDSYKDTFIDTMPHHDKLLNKIAELNNISKSELLDLYMDAAMGLPVIIKTYQA